jgi:hypothetical protein
MGGFRQLLRLSDIETELRNFLEEHFQRTTDATVFIYYSDFVDFIFERTDLPIDKVKTILSLWRQSRNSDLEIHDDRVYGLQCVTDVDINMAEDERASSSDDDASWDSEEDF